MEGLLILTGEIKFYEDCAMNKLTRLKFPPGGNQAYDRLYIIYSDICGPMNISTYQGNWYFIIFINDYSRKAQVYFIKTKDQVFEKFSEFKAQVENKINQCIKILHTDSGGKYINGWFKSLLKQEGIRYQVIAPHTL